jgi:hypothetical protein
LKKKGTIIEKEKIEPYLSFQNDKETYEEYATIGEKTIGKKVDSAPN